MKLYALAIPFLLLLFSFQQLNSIKVSDRWANLKDENARCLILVATRTEIEQHEQLHKFINMVHPIDYLFKKYNCTLVERDYVTTGSPDENGTYDGFIGIVQRNEVDGAFMLLRYDSLAFEPAKLTPPVGPADIAIYSYKKYGETREDRDLTSFLDLGLCVYVYLFTTCFFMAPMMLAFCQLNSEQRMNPVTVMKKYIGNCFRVLTLFVGQEQFELSMASSYILILSVGVFTSIWISGILLNTVGADLIVKRGPPVIASLEDLLNSPLKPVFPKIVFGYSAMSRRNQQRWAWTSQHSRQSHRHSRSAPSRSLTFA